MTETEATEVRGIADTLARVGDFIWRPDLNRDIIGVVDRAAKRLHELANET